MDIELLLRVGALLFTFMHLLSCIYFYAAGSMNKYI